MALDDLFQGNTTNATAKCDAFSVLALKASYLAQIRILDYGAACFCNKGKESRAARTAASQSVSL